MDSALRELERAWQAAPDDEGALDRLLAELRRAGLDPVERLAALSSAPWADVLRASLPILRRGTPGGPPIFGRRLWVLVDNFSHHHSHADVFADGLIDCWGVVDRELFARKLSDDCGEVGPPVVTRVRSGEDVSLDDLGRGYVFGGERWDASREDLVAAAGLVVRALAEPGAPLLDLEGNDSELVDGQWHPKRSLGQVQVYRRTDEGTLVEGEPLQVFLLDGALATLAQWLIYADGTSQVIGLPADPRPLVPCEEVAARVGRDLVTELPPHTVLALPGLGMFQLGPEPRFYIEPAERVREARDLLAQLRGAPSAGVECRAAFERYEREEARPSSPDREDALMLAREALRAAYQAVPEHLRRYVLGDMDRKDGPIRHALQRQEEDEDAPPDDAPT
jgi:hypothetical protein